MRSSLFISAVIVCMVAGCENFVAETPANDPPVSSGTSVSPALSSPPGSAPGTCWENDATPAVIETITEENMVQPAEVLADGTVVSEAVFKTETRLAIVVPRREIWFEIPCDDIMNPDFVASLQRALKVRRLYHGAVSGEMDAQTRRAIRRFQAPLDLDSAILSLEAARLLGLVEVNNPPSDG